MPDTKSAAEEIGVRLLRVVDAVHWVLDFGHDAGLHAVAGALVHLDGLLAEVSIYTCVGVALACEWWDQPGDAGRAIIRPLQIVAIKRVMRQETRRSYE